MPDKSLHRRDVLSFATRGIGALALTDLLLRDSHASKQEKPTESQVSWPHFPPRVRRVIQVVLCGGLSQVDSLDYKPLLHRYHGTPLVSQQRPDVFFGQVGLLRKNDWAFKQRGQSGLWISDLFPHLSQVADELTVINSMYAETSNHTPATFQQNTGFRLNGFPTCGAWLSYGMGSETDELPSYIVIPDSRGVPAGGSINWSNGFLSARHQGVVLRGTGQPLDELFPAEPIRRDTELASRELLAGLNQRHLQKRGNSDALLARMRSYELAARMQSAVPVVADLDRETALTQRQYGLTAKSTADFGRSCLLARRLVERGVRFVQLFSGGAFVSPRINWDGHENMIKNHGREAARIDRPLAALLRDLRQRGLLDDTLVLFTSEFGRTPFAQSSASTLGTGRDHNQNGFSVWLAGAGLRGGMTYGSTDDVGWKSVDQRVHWHDFHATVLHLLGIDHRRLTFYHNGIQRRLTNVHGNVIKTILS